MSLVVCKACGKSFSDTREECIHCGAPLREETVIQRNEQEEGVGLKEDFEKQSSERKLQLEYEFINENNAAYRYKQKTTHDKFATSTMVFSILFFICYFFLNLFLVIGSDEGIINIDVDSVIIENYMWVSLGLSIIVPIIMIVSKIIETIVIEFNRNSIKKYVYIKEFQKWLFEKKNINYIPIFNRDSQKEIFDNIDLKYMKL